MPASPPTCCAPSSANYSTTPRPRSTEALTRLGFTDEAQLAAAIRAGELDDRADEVAACLRTLVEHRLAVAHPGYDQRSQPGLKPAWPAPTTRARRPVPRPVGREPPRAPHRRRRDRRQCRALPAPTRRRTPPGSSVSLTCGPNPRPASESASTCTSAPGRHAACRLRDVFRAVGVVENVEQCAVDDGVVARLVAEIHCVRHFEAGVDPLRGGVVAGLLDGIRREVDAETSS